MRGLYLTVFLVSGAVLVLEIALTRLFSIYLSYHFAFMVISIAMLGIGSAGTVLSLSRMGKIHPSPLPVNPRVAVLSLLAGVSIVAGYAVSNRIPFDPITLSWDSRQVLFLGLYCFVLGLPFFFSGMVIATAFWAHSEESGLIYGSDLIGAGTGSLAALGILQRAGPEYAVLAASGLCCAASLVTGGRKTRPAALLVVALICMLFLAQPDFLRIRLSPYKPLSLSLTYPGAEHLETYYNAFSRIDTLRSPAVRFAPGLSLTYLNDLPEQIGMSIDGGQMNAVTGTDSEEELSFLRFLPSALAYEIKRRGLPEKGLDVLVLEPKGGLQAVMAEAYSDGETYKIESNPLVVEILQGDLSGFSGGLYERNTWTGLGRSILRNQQFRRQSSPPFDIIDLPMTGVSPSGTFGITEDYRFTVEAFGEYLDALGEEGLLSISLYILPPPRTELRIAATVVRALHERGVSDAALHVAALRSWDSLVILVKNSPLRDDEIEHIRDFARERRFDLLSYPGIKEDETNRFIRMSSREYPRAFASLLDQSTGQLFQEGYLFDIRPVTDESPFFHSYLRLNNIKAIYEVMGNKWQYFIDEGYLLPVLFLQVLLLSLVLILLPVLTVRQGAVQGFSPAQGERKRRISPALLYFGLLGLGFMFVEVTLIQKGILALVNPSYSFAVVLTAMLFSSGLGSIVGSRFPLGRLIPVLVALICLYSLALPAFLSAVAPYSLKVKIPAFFLALLPLGFCMGVPFPAGMRILGQEERGLIPWAWAVNGCLSVISPIVTVMLAMVWGFQRVLWFGAAAYLCAYIALRRMK